MAVFWYWRNLVICTCNCTYDVLSFMLWLNHCAFSACIAYASLPSMWIENGDFWGRKLYSRLSCFQKYLEPNHREELNCVRVRERTNTEDLYAVAVIRRSVAVWPCPPRYLCHPVVLETKSPSTSTVYSSTELSRKIWPRACALCVHVWVVLTSCLFISEDLNLARV